MKVSVIIPALNEGAGIAHTLACVQRSGPNEIIVVDGGSTDDTVKRARGIARVVSAPPGRAAQMNRGAEVAAGDVLFFLHADTLPPAGAVDGIRRLLADPTVEAGAFRLRFDRSTPLLRLYSLCTRLPLTRICFGDRGLFVRRAAFRAVGGFPPVPIFEDLELVRLLHRRGGFRFAPDAVVTSARRFARVGPLRQQVLNTSLWLRYLLGADPARLAHRYPYSPSRTTDNTPPPA